MSRFKKRAPKLHKAKNPKNLPSKNDSRLHAFRCIQPDIKLLHSSLYSQVHPTIAESSESFQRCFDLELNQVESAASDLWGLYLVEKYKVFNASTLRMDGSPCAQVPGHHLPVWVDALMCVCFWWRGGGGLGEFHARERLEKKGDNSVFGIRRLQLIHSEKQHVCTDPPVSWIHFVHRL